MNREYPISTGYKFFYYIIALGMIAFVLFLFSRPSDINTALFIILFVTASVALAIMINMFKSKIIVSENSIIRTNIFKTKELYFTDIKGFRADSKIITLESASASISKMKIFNYEEYADHKDLELWIRDKFKDLDNIEFQEDVAILLNDPNIGFTEADRKSRIRKARNISMIYGVGLIIPATGIFFFFDMKILDIIMLIYPLLAIPIMLTSNGLIRFYIKKNSPFLLRI